MKDPIVEEIRRIRAEIAAEHGNDLHQIFENARRQQGADGRPVISFEPANAGETACVLREEPPKPK